ncbi:MAG: response regulator [Lentimicrobium sp.]|nr:response regulator [Lentimicrobium sp.]
MAENTDDTNIINEPGIKILIAEDEESNYLYLEKLLSKSGFRTLRAKNGSEAIELVRLNKDISLVLMDIKMPGKNGIEATQEIKQFRPDIPIIATTAFAIPGDREIFLKARCDEYITKPIKPELILKMIKKFVTNQFLL